MVSVYEKRFKTWLNLNTNLISHTASSRGRGPRVAGWFADYLADHKDESMESLVLAGGVKGWATAGEDYVKYMTAYDESVWLKD